MRINNSNTKGIKQKCAYVWICEHQRVICYVLVNMLLKMALEREKLFTERKILYVVLIEDIGIELSTIAVSVERQYSTKNGYNGAIPFQAHIYRIRGPQIKWQ